MIAPGIKCPKCGSAMLDDRANKRTDKSPDYTCSNMLCMDKSGKCRTAIWEKDATGSTPAATAPQGVTGGSAPAPEGAAPDRPKLTKLYLDATEFVIEKVLPKYVQAGVEVSDTAIIAAVATLFIAGSKERA